MMKVENGGGMIKNLFIVFLMLVVCTSVVLAQHQVGWVDDYRGVIGDNIKIGISLTISGNDVSGVYFYYRWLKDISVKGKIDGRNITLDEFDEKGNVVATFKGYFPDHAPEYLQQPIKYEVIEGEWARPDGTGRKRFRVVMESSTSLMGNSRYSVAGFDDKNVVESVAKKFKESVIAYEKSTVASLVEYPIRVSMNGKEVDIKDKDAFVQRYDDIFYEAFVNRIKDSVPHNMFAKATGVMLGERGEVWIGDKNGKARIIAINNGEWK